MQKDLDVLHEWSRTWDMEFNAKKCHVLKMGKSERRPEWIYKMGEEVIKRNEHERDLGVIVQDNLSPEKHINNIFGDAYGMLRNVRTAFNYMDKDTMRKILITMIRPKLEYAVVVWSAHKKKHIRKLERIEKIATTLVPE